MSRHRVHGVAALSAAFLLSAASIVSAVEADSLRDELARIFGPEKHYEPEAFGPARWLLGGESYTTLEPSVPVEGAKDIVRYESGSGKREVLVEAKSLVPPGETKPVHYQGTERLVNRLVQLGKRFDLMVYPNRSHAISEGDGTSLHIYSLIARYLIENLSEID